MLITGGTGLLGKKAYSMLCKDHDVICTYNTTETKGFMRLDISNQNIVREIIQEINPDVVIHTAAFNNVDHSDEDRKLAWDINSVGNFNLSNVCQKHKTKLVTITTDYIFSGLNSPYLENDIPHPLGFYGMSKLIGEKIALNVCSGSIAIRLPILYGYNDENDKPTVVSDVIQKLSAGKEVIITDYRIKYPTLIDDVVRNIMVLIEKDTEGIYHFSPKKYTTRFDWAISIAEIFGLDNKLIEKGPERRFSNRPHNVFLENTKDNDLKFNELMDGLNIVKKQKERKNEDSKIPKN